MMKGLNKIKYKNLENRKMSYWVSLWLSKIKERILMPHPMNENFVKEDELIWIMYYKLVPTHVKLVNH